MIDLEFYSPVEKINDRLFEEKHVHLFIKRDDLIHPFISGNKWRKLKYILRKARAEQKNHLVTFGGGYSNHLLATACAAARFGFKSTGIVRGENIQNEILALCQLFGMKLHFVNRTSYRDKHNLFQTYFNKNEGAFFIDEGGASAEALCGCAELIDELDTTYDHIFCAAGTGTTAAGIIKGLNQRQPDTQMHVVPVLKDGLFIKTAIENYFAQPPRLNLHLNYHFGGYAKTKPELLSFIHQLAASTGILSDPVYTGKLLYAIYDLVEKNYFKKESKILAIHTGGLFGIMGMIKKFGTDFTG